MLFLLSFLHFWFWLASSCALYKGLSPMMPWCPLTNMVGDQLSCRGHPKSQPDDLPNINIPWGGQNLMWIQWDTTQQLLNNVMEFTSSRKPTEWYNSSKCLIFAPSFCWLRPWLFICSHRPHYLWFQAPLIPGLSEGWRRVSAFDWHGKAHSASDQWLSSW